MRGIGSLCLLLLMAIVAPARAEDAADKPPILRIETGMHGATINRLAVDEAGGRFITVSDDKTTRLWSLADGAMQRVFRTEIGAGDAGSLYAAAVNGDNLVVGGFNGTPDGTIYVFNLKTNTLRGSIDKFHGAITALAFSKDGHYLAVADEGVVLTLIDFTALKSIATDKSYTAKIRWLGFSADGHLASTADDGEIRVLDGALRETARAKLPTPSDRPWGLAFSPDGTRLAVGDRTKPQIAVFNLPGLTAPATLGGADATAGDLSVVAWSPDGTRVAAAGGYRRADQRRLIRTWQAAGGTLGQPADQPVAGDTVTDLALLSTGETIYTSAEPSLGIIAPDGAERVHHKSDHADYRDGAAAFKLSRDGSVVEFPTAQGGKRLQRFDLLEGLLARDPPPDDSLKPAVTKDAKLSPTGWLNGTSPKVAGQSVALDPNEHVRSAAIVPTMTGAATRVAFGTDFYLRAVGTGGDKGWRTVIPAPAWVVAASADGRYVVAGLGDGTIRWYAADDGHQIMTLFVDSDDGRWVVWLPECFFDHSEEPGKPGGETLVGYQTNHGPNRLADFVEMGQMYEKFERRDLVIARFRGDAAQEKLVENQISRTGDFRSVLKTGLPPALKLLDYCIVDASQTACPAGTGKPVGPDQTKYGVAGTGTSLFARYSVSDRGGGIGPVVIRRNDAVIDGTRKVESDDAKSHIETVVLPLKAEGNSIAFSAKTANGAIETAPDDAIIIDAKPTIPATAAADNSEDVTLYGVVVGVSHYDQAAFRLENPANDARALYDTLTHPTPPVYTKADVTLLIDNDATVSKIADALTQVAGKARPQDIVIIFFAGHGEAVDNKYYFAPVDFATKHLDEVEQAKETDEAGQEAIIHNLFREEGLGEATLFPLFARIQGNMLLILDTCFSASIATSDAVAEKAHNDTLTQGIGHDTGRFVLAGSWAAALDSPGKVGTAAGGQHGLFTYYLLKGLSGDADRAHEGRVAVDDLLKYTQTTVKAESHKIHEDQVPRYQLGGNQFFDVRAVPVKGGPTESSSPP